MQSLKFQYLPYLFAEDPTHIYLSMSSKNPIFLMLILSILVWKTTFHNLNRFKKF